MRALFKSCFVCCVMTLCSYSAGLDITVQLYQVDNYPQMMQFVFPKLTADANSDLKKAVAIKTWELYKSELSSLPIFENDDLQELLAVDERTEGIPSDLYSRWLHVLQFTKTYEDLTTFVFPNICGNEDQMSKIAIAKGAWEIFVAPMIPSAYENIDDLNSVVFAQKSLDVSVVLQSAQAEGQGVCLKRYSRIVRSVVHFSSVTVNLLVRTSQAIRSMRHTNMLRRMQRISVVVQTVFPFATRFVPLVNAVAERQFYRIPPVQYVATALLICDAVVTVIDIGINKITER